MTLTFNKIRTHELILLIVLHSQVSLVELPCAAIHVVSTTSVEMGLSLPRVVHRNGGLPMGLGGGRRGKQSPFGAPYQLRSELINCFVQAAYMTMDVNENIKRRQYYVLLNNTPPQSWKSS